MKSCIAVKNRNCTFLYPSTSRHIRFYLYIRQLQDCKALSHEFYTNGQHDIFDAVAGNVLVGGDGNYYFIDTVIYPSDTGGYDLYRSLSPRFSGEGV